MLGFGLRKLQLVSKIKVRSRLKAGVKQLEEVRLNDPCIVKMPSRVTKIEQRSKRGARARGGWQRRGSIRERDDHHSPLLRRGCDSGTGGNSCTNSKYSSASSHCRDLSRCGRCDSCCWKSATVPQWSGCTYLEITPVTHGVPITR